MYTPFWHRITFSGCRTGIQFDDSVLIEEQNSYAIKIVNAYIVYNLDDWSKILLNNFKLKTCLFGEINIREDSDKSKMV